MTASDIDKVIVYLREKLPKLVNDEGIVCHVADLFDTLRKYPVESDKTAGPDYKAMYEATADELRKALERNESIRFDMHNLSIEHAQYVGAVAAMETIFGRKFEPQR